MALKETHINRSNEQRICNYLDKCLGDDFTISDAMQYKHYIDRGILYKDYLVAWLEIKRRNIVFTTAQYLNISMHKIKAGIECSMITDKPFFLVVESMKDNDIKIANIEHDALKKYNIYWGGYKNPRPNAPNDREFMVNIPIENFNSFQYSELSDLRRRYEQSRWVL